MKYLLFFASFGIALLFEHFEYYAIMAVYASASGATLWDIMINDD